MLSTTTNTTTQWLSKLKISELHRLAVILGTPCSGTKVSRIDGIKQVLGMGLKVSSGSGNGRGDEVRKGRKDGMGNGRLLPLDGGVGLPEKIRVVSIDMGIRNLAFACLSCDFGRGGSRNGEGGGDGDGRSGIGGGGYGRVRLTAWRKIDVAGSSSSDSMEISDLGDGHVTGDLSSSRDIIAADGDDNHQGDHDVQKKARKSKLQQQDKNDSEMEEDEDGKVSPGDKSKKQTPIATNSFEPSVYADHAYRIITSIITKYNPTHILIERQRFRSGGSSAVLEWTIRVGVFEGMLYAVLRALAGESQKTNQLGVPIVEGMLPARVNRFWLDDSSNNHCEIGSTDDQGDNIDDTTDTKKKKKLPRMKGRDVKKAKIEMVGKILERCNIQPKHATTQSTLHPHSYPSTTIPQIELEEDVQSLADYFTTEVKRPLNARRRNTTKSGPNGKEEESLSNTKISKLDDLADCLLQGLAWIQWQNNRSKVGMLGKDAFDVISKANEKVS